MNRKTLFRYHAGWQMVTLACFFSLVSMMMVEKVDLRWAVIVVLAIVSGMLSVSWGQWK